MVSRSFAEKILRSAQDDISTVIGRQIYNEDMAGLKLPIEGVFEDFPKNGSLDYDILLAIETYGKQSTDNWLGNDRYKGYVKLMPGVDPNTLTDAIRKMQEAHQPLEQIEAQGTSLRYFLKPFSTLHRSGAAHPDFLAELHPDCDFLPGEAFQGSGRSQVLRRRG